MATLKGKNSGIVFDLPESIAAGLVRTGAAIRVDEAETKTVTDPPKTADTDPKTEDPQGNTGGSEDGTKGDGEGSTENEPAAGGADADDKKPAGNASRDDWVAYALTQGKTEDDLQGLKQGEIRALFNTEE